MDEIEKIISDLTSDDAEVRLKAAWKLGVLGDSSAIPKLIRVLREDVDLRTSASAVLQGLGPTAPLPPLADTSIDKISKKEHVDPENYPPQKLGKIRKIGVPVLIVSLKDEDWQVREKVAEALGRIGDKSAVPALIEALRDVHENVRFHAAKALRLMRAISAIPALIYALRDSVDAVRWEASVALSAIGKPAVPGLIEALEDEDDNVRWCAAETLGKIGDISASLALIGLLKDRNENVRRGANWALEKILERLDDMEDMEELEAFEKDLKEGYAFLAKKFRNRDELIEIRMEVAKLMKEVSERKNGLSSKRSIILKGKPRSPKRGKLYQAARRVRNG